MKVWRWCERVAGAVRKSVARFAWRRKLVCVAFAAGLGAFLALGAGFTLSLTAALAACMAALGGAICGAKNHKKGAFACLLLAVFLFFQEYAALRAVQPADLTAMRGNLTGTICREPLSQRNNQRLVLTLDNASCDGAALKGKVRLYIYGTDEIATFEYGDRVTVENANITLPKGRTNPGGFDFSAYLWRNGVTYCASGSLSKIVLEGQEPSLWRTLFRWRRAALGRVDELYGENADVMRAILLGDRSQMSEETYEDFRNSGIAHIIALSGLHVSCLALLIDWLLRGLLLPKRLRSAITIALLCLYAALTGASASVVRAVIMYAALCATRDCGYPHDLLTRVCLAFLCQLSAQPLIMMDTGFQLTYMAMLALACLNKLLSGRPGENKRGLRLRLWQAGSASLSVQLATLPLVCSLFYSVPLLALPVNLVTVPLGLLTVFSGAVSLGVSFVWLPLARILAWPGSWIWSWVKWLTAKVVSLPFAVIATRAWPLALGGAFLVWVLMLSPYFGIREQWRKRGLIVLPLLFLAVLCWPRDIPQGMRVTFLDVNYGDSAVIDVGDDTYVIDCGKNNGILCDYLTQAGARVRGVFLTHPDSDHAGGLTELLRRWDYATVYVPDCWYELDVSAELEQSLQGVKVKTLSAGDKVTLREDLWMDVLWPEEGFVPESDNDGCLVLRVNYGEARVLFMGDLTDQYDAQAVTDCDVLKVAHHGSKYATSAAMLETAHPRYAVISVAPNNYGHPTNDVLQRLNTVGAEVFRTDEDGAIIMNFTKDGTIDVCTMLASEGIR